MRVAFLSDVHANLEALKATLADIKRAKVDCVHFLGDAVGYGPDPIACVELLERHCQIKILGNHDSAALGIDSARGFNELARVSLEWTVDTINDSCREALADYEMTAEFDMFCLTHASPEAPEKWEYILTPDDAEEQFAHFSTQVLVVGHSHLPVVFRCDSDGQVSHRQPQEFTMELSSRYIINAGSVGQPRDHDPRACYVTVDTDTRVVKYHRVAYDVAKAKERILMAGLPVALGERLLLGR